MHRSDSFILKGTATLIAIIVQILAVYLFFRGHNLPGGGFIAGVASGIGVLLLVLANGTKTAPRICPFDPLRLCAWGLAVATLAGLPGLVFSNAFLTQYHYKNTDFPILGSLYLGTPLVFDLGVFMVVLGVIIKVTFVLLDALNKQAQEFEPVFHLPRGRQDYPLEATEKDEGRPS